MCFLAVVLATSTAFAQLLSRQWAILPASEGPRLLDQCSRSAPTEVSGFWTPSAVEIDQVEERLPQLMRSSGYKVVISRTRRQYIGFISHGEKLIYLNAFPDSDPRLETPVGLENQRLERL